MRRINIEQTTDLEHWVAQEYDHTTDEWNDISMPFETFDEAVEWAKCYRDAKLETSMPF